MKHSVGEHFIGGFEGTQITPEIRKLITKYKIGGFVLFRRNIESIPHVKKLIADLQKIADYPLWMGVDQEGGNVFRLGPPFTTIPPMAVVGEFYKKTKHLQTVKKIGRILGKELAAVGFNWDYAPVVDVHSNPKNPIIAKRSFGPNPLIVSRCAGALISGLHAEGILSCAKHFPGHGGTSADSHIELPVLKADGRLLWKRDLYPYRKLFAQNKILTLMTAHVRYPGLDAEHCATLSRKILTDLLRKKMKYTGLVISDDMLMKAIADRFGIPDATAQFFYAGGDIALICNQPALQMEAMEHLQQITAEDPDMKAWLAQSAKRIARLKKRFLTGWPQPPLRVIGAPEHQKIVAKLG